MATYVGGLSKYNGKIPTYEGLIVAEYGLYIEDLANGYDLTTSALLYFPEINRVMYYETSDPSHFIFCKDWCCGSFDYNKPTTPLSKNENVLHFIKSCSGNDGFDCSPEELYNLTINNKDLSNKTNIKNDFEDIDLYANTQYYWCHSYLMNQIYNNWYNNYYLLGKTSNWVQLYEDDAFSKVEAIRNNHTKSSQE